MKIRTASCIPAVLALALTTGALADTFSETVMIPTNVRFGNVAVSAGLYQVGTSRDGSLLLQALRGGEPLRIAATAGKHGSPVNEPMAVAFEADQGMVHLLMLSPDGRQLEAVGTSGAAAARRVRPSAARIDYAIRQTAGRIRQARLASGIELAPAAPLARRRPTSMVQAAKVRAAAAEAEPEPPEDNPVEYLFRVPLDLKSVPETHESVMVHAMLATTPLDGMVPSGNGKAVGWGQIYVEIPPNGRLDTIINLPVDWYGPGPENDVPFPRYYYVAVGGFAPCGSNYTDWHGQARCGTPYRPLVTGELPP